MIYMYMVSNSIAFFNSKRSPKSDFGACDQRLVFTSDRVGVGVGVIRDLI